MPAAENAMFSVTDLSQANAKSPRGISEREQKLRLAVNFRPVNLKQILEYISMQDIDPELKVILVKQVSRYPSHAIQRFADNFEQMVNVAQRKIRKTYTVESAIIKPVDDDIKPFGPHHRNTPAKVENKPLIKPKKIDLNDMDFASSDLLQAPVESLDGIPVSVSVSVNVNNDVPKPVPVPKPQPPRQKPVIFSAQLSDQDFE